MNIMPIAAASLCTLQFPILNNINMIAAETFFALMMEAARTSETSVNFYQTTRRYNPEEIHLISMLQRN
jgi:hypothetical protein